LKLQFRLMLMILPVLIVIVSIISITTGLISTSALKNQARENAQLLSHSYAGQIDSTIKIYQNMSRDLGSASITAINIETTLQVFRERYPQFVHVFYTSFSGEVLEMAPYHKDNVGFDLKGIEGWQSAFDSHLPTISKPGLYFGEKSIIFFAPAIYSFVKHQEPRVEGMVALVLPLRELFREIENITIGQSGSLFVLDETSTFLHNDMEEMILSLFSDYTQPNESLDKIIRAMIDQKSGFGTYSDGEGSKYISFSPIATVKWSLGVNGSYKEITAGISHITQINLLVMIFGLILAIVSLYFVVHSVVSPIEKLTKMAGRIEQGDFEQKILIKSQKGTKKTKDEVTKLIFAFNKMTDQLNHTFISLNNEINEREKTEFALSEAQNYLNNIVDSMPSMVIGVDSEGNVTHWNKAAENITGIQANFAYNKVLTDVLPQMIGEMDKISASIESGTSIYDKKVPYKRENDLYFEDITIYPLVGSDIEGAVIRIDDVTDKVRLEEIMIQSEKMLSVGGLAAGMAHEINNPLAGMIQTATVMENRLSKRLNMPANVKAVNKLGISIDIIRDFMEERGIIRMLSSINESGRRVAEIVENMLSFSRKSEKENSTHNLQELLDATLKLASTDFDLKSQFDFKKIEIIREFEENLPMVHCEGSKIQQVLLNLFRNGAQAMIEAGNDSPQFTVRLYHIKDESMICMEIEDNGPGMDDETRKRIFEPFFTTKPVGVGTGLGLSVSYFIITENHKGEMFVKSEKGKGATFIIKLPVEQLVIFSND